MPRWPQARAGRNEAQSADARGGIAPPRSNDALRSAPLTQGGFACSTQDTTHCANPPAATPTRCGSIGYGNNPAEAAPSLQHCQLRRLLRRGTAACGKLPVSAPPPATPALLSRSTRFENKNLALSATFLRLGAAAISLNTDIGSKVQQINCWEAFSVFCGWARIANRKKVAERARFLFLHFRNGTIGFSAMKQREQLAREGNAGD